MLFSRNRKWIKASLVAVAALVMTVPAFAQPGGGGGDGGRGQGGGGGGGGRSGGGAARSAQGGARGGTNVQRGGSNVRAGGGGSAQVRSSQRPSNAQSAPNAARGTRSYSFDRGNTGSSVNRSLNQAQQNANRSVQDAQQNGQNAQRNTNRSVQDAQRNTQNAQRSAAQNAQRNNQNFAQDLINRGGNPTGAGRQPYQVNRQDLDNRSAIDRATRDARNQADRARDQIDGNRVNRSRDQQARDRADQIARDRSRDRDYDRDRSWDRDRYGNNNGRNFNNNRYSYRRPDYWRQNSYFFGGGSPFGAYLGYPWYSYGGNYGWGNRFGYGGYGQGYGWGNNGLNPGYFAYQPTVGYQIATTAQPQQQPTQTEIAESLNYAAQGELAFSEGRYQDAVVAWRHAIVDDPSNGAILLLLGQALFQTGQYEEAAGAVQQAIRVLPDEQWGVVVTNYQRLYGNRAGDFTAELKQLEQARSQEPNSAPLHFLLGYQFGYLGYPQQAVRELNKVLEIAPEDQVTKTLHEKLSALPAPEKASG